jgi:hypothetical protein
VTRFDNADDIGHAFSEQLQTHYHRFMVFSHAGAAVQLHKDAYGMAFWNVLLVSVLRLQSLIQNLY